MIPFFLVALIHDEGEIEWYGPKDEKRIKRKVLSKFDDDLSLKLTDLDFLNYLQINCAKLGAQRNVCVV